MKLDTSSPKYLSKIAFGFTKAYVKVYNIDLLKRLPKGEIIKICEGCANIDRKYILSAIASLRLYLKAGKTLSELKEPLDVSPQTTSDKIQLSNDTKENT